MKKNVVIIFLIVFLAACSTVNSIVDEIASAQKQKSSDQYEKSEERTEIEGTPIEIQENTPWDSTGINTVENESYLSNLEKEIIIELNKVRTKPKEYSDYYLEPMRTLYRGNILQYPGEIALRTSEGLSALNECINLLKKKKSTGVLKTTKGLYQAARDHMEDQSKTGKTGHSGSDGSSPSDRMSRYGQWKMTAGENVAYGPSIARRIVINLLVDDGVPSRGHRKNILNADFMFVGVSHGYHPQIRTVTVMDFAGGYEDK